MNSRLWLNPKIARRYVLLLTIFIFAAFFVGLYTGSGPARVYGVVLNSLRDGVFSEAEHAAIDAANKSAQDRTFWFVAVCLPLMGVLLILNIVVIAHDLRIERLSPLRKELLSK